NTLPVRVEVRGEERVIDLMRRLHERQSKVLDYEYSPLMEVQGWSEAPRGTPLFETIYVFQNYPLDAGLTEHADGDLRISEVTETTKNNYGITVRGVPGKELLLNVLYDSGRYEGGSIERLLKRLERVLEGLAEGEKSRVMELSLMSEEERQQVIGAWNATEAAYPHDKCIHELFEQQVELTPDAVAVVYEGESVSYRELNRRANRLAHYLREMGVGAEGKVGLCVEGSLEMMVGLLGVIKAGGAYLPLDADYPRERLAYMIEDCGCPVIVTTGRQLEELPVTWAQIVKIDEDWPAIADEREGNTELITVPANFAYVMDTSGSTGRPKGVMVAHRGLCNLIWAQKEAFGLGAHSRVLQFASLSFDASVSEIFCALASGGSLHIHSKESLKAGDELVRILREDQITTVTLPPSALGVLREEGLPHLQAVIAAGEECSAEIVKRWGRGRKFFDAYGPTEATVCASIGECEAGDKGKV